MREIWVGEVWGMKDDEREKVVGKEYESMKRSGYERCLMGCMGLGKHEEWSPMGITKYGS